MTKRIIANVSMIVFVLSIHSCFCAESFVAGLLGLFLMGFAYWTYAETNFGKSLIKELFEQSKEFDEYLSNQCKN